MTLALLITAATGAWADVTITWGSAELSSLTDNYLSAGATKTVNGITVTVNAGTNNFIAVTPVGTTFSATNDNAFTFSTELGNFTKIECTSLNLSGTLGDGWDGATWTGDANSVNMSKAGSFLAVSSITFTIGEPAATTDYYLVGTMNDWGASKQFLLTPNPGNAAEYMITLNLKADTQLKVIGVEEGKETVWYPGEGGNYVVNDAGQYTVYFRPDGQGGEGWHEGCIYLAPAPAPAVPLTDLGSGQWQFQMPDYAVVAKIEYDTELELQEENVNTAVLADWDGYEADITLKRKLVAGSWNTLAVPFNVSSQMLGYLTSTYGMSVKQLASTTLENEGKTLMLTFTDATEMVAGTPYLVKVTTDFDFSAQALPDVVISKELNPVTTTYADFVPTLGKTTIDGVAADDVLFVAAGNTLKNPGTIPTDMKGFRAYFLLKNVPAAARAFALNLGDESTGIESLTASPMGEGSIYTLDGRRIGKAAQKGVYIQNGKKVIIRSATQGDACQSKT